MPRPSLGGKVKPNSRRPNPRVYPATGPAAATFSRSPRFRTMLTILVMEPNDPIYRKYKNEMLVYYGELDKLGMVQK